MTKINAQKLFGSSESTTIEWKPSLSQAHDIIESITAFANTEGGRLFIGISKVGEIIGVQVGKGTIEDLVNRIAQHTDPKIQPKITVKKIEDKQIIIIEVKPSKDKLALADGRPYKRVGPSTRQMGKDEYEGLILEKHKTELDFDSQICKGAKIQDISREKIIAFIKKAKKERGLNINPSAPISEILKRLKLIKDNKITNAAIVLFGKDPQDFFLQAELKAIRFRGYDVTGEMIDFKTISADAITLLEKAENFIFEHIPMKAWIESGKLQRQEKWLYPPDAIREALANALAHRDYRSTGRVQVRIFDDRLEIWNPGILPQGLTIEKLKRKHDSMPRNPSIARAFFWVKYVEEVGTGTEKILKWCRKWGLPEPKYEEAGGSFVVTFGQSRFSDDYLASIKLNDRQQTAVGFVKQNKQISNNQYRELTKSSKNTATRDLNELVEKGILHSIGQGRSLKYEFKE